MSAHSQKLFISRRRNGRYLLGKLHPARVPIAGTDNDELWPEHGDPMSTEICEFAAEKLLGCRLDPLATAQVIVTFSHVA